MTGSRRGKPVGKQVAQRTYLHVHCLDRIEAGDVQRIARAEALAGITRGESYNVIKLEADPHRLSLLGYDRFFDEPFPELREAWTVDLVLESVGYRTYADSLNPPILHRKELLLPLNHPRYREYAAVTEAAESIGLFDDPTRIGFKQYWHALIREKGYRLAGHQLVPIGNDESEPGEPTTEPAVPKIARHLTALARYGFSAPIQSLARYGFLDGRFSVFDYGCGRGDDVRGLLENGLRADGWDPYYAPDHPTHSADIVNLGFVINVIEDLNERVDALRRAYSLADRILVVAVMLANQNALAGQRFNDGVLTRRGTFQKYYTQAELKVFLEEVLQEEPIAIGPGIFYVFCDKEAEQRFLAERYRSRRRDLLRQPARLTVERPPRERRDRAEAKYQVYREPLDRLWEQWLILGREPERDEVEDLPALTEAFGSLGKALRFIAGRQNETLLQQARQARMADLTVYLALDQFEKRRAYKHLEPGLQRDIKAFFGDYATARQLARELLFRIADASAIAAACKQAAEHGLGWLEEGESLQLHVRLVEQLPPLLRVYVSCAALLYGDYRNADLIKIHLRSGKLTLLRFDDFENRPLPRMVERVKIKLRRQDFDYFGYGDEYEPPFLFHKSRYINEEFPHYPEQLAFDEALERLAWLDLSGYGPQPAEFSKTLESHRWAVEGFKLVRSRTLPDLDARCGRYLTYRQLIECGETRARTGLPNRPREPDSYTALYDLAVNILDPVIEYFGMIELTYGFCSSELARHIPGRIALRLDQHAAHELNSKGQPLCARLGAAVDFSVADENMREVADWIVENTPFDRLYFYGEDRPVHVSYGPEQKRDYVDMVVTATGKPIPRRRQLAKSA